MNFMNDLEFRICFEVKVVIIVLFKVLFSLFVVRSRCMVFFKSFCTCFTVFVEIGIYCFVFNIVFDVFILVLCSDLKYLLLIFFSCVCKI